MASLRRTILAAAPAYAEDAHHSAEAAEAPPAAAPAPRPDVQAAA